MNLAVQEDNEIAVQIAEQMERELLGDWLVVFSRTLAQKAQSPLYVALGRLLEDLWNLQGRVSEGA